MRAHSALTASASPHHHSRHARLSALRAACAMLIALCVACDASPPAPASPADSAPATASTSASHTSASPAKPDGAPVIANAGDVSVTLDDYAQAVRRMRLFTRERAPGEDIPARVLKNPRFQQKLTLDLLDWAIWRREADARGIRWRDIDIDTKLSEEPALRPFAPLDPEARAARLARDGLTPEDLAHVVRERAMIDLLSAALVPTPDDKALWDAWRRLQERAVLDYVTVPNTPSSEALTRFVARHPEEAERYWREHPKAFKVAETRRVSAIVLPAGVSPDADAKARTKLSSIRRDVLAGGDFASLARAHSTHPSSARGGELGFVVRRQHPQVFAVAQGEVTEPVRTSMGWTLFKVNEVVPDHIKPLTPGVRREAAAALLRARGPNGAPLKVARALVAAWRAGGARDAPPAKDIAAQAKVRIAQTLPFELEPGAPVFIPGIGDAPPVFQAAAKLTPEAPVHPEPIFHDGNLYVIALRSRGEASRTRFEAAKARFAQDWLSAERERAMRGLVLKAQRDTPPTLDLKPVQARYGADRAKRGVEPQPPASPQPAPFK